MLRTSRNIFGFICLLILVSSCRQIQLSELNSEEFGLVSRVRQVNEVVTLQYRPLYTLYIQKHQSIDAKVKRKDIEEELGNYINFNLTILRESSPSDGKKISIADLQSSLTLDYGSQTISCAFAQPELLANQSRYTLSFPSPVTYGNDFKHDIKVNYHSENESFAFQFDKEKLNRAEGLLEHFKKQLGK